MIEITCFQEGGIRRGNHRHPKGTETYPDDTFTEKQMAAIEADPRLKVVRKADPEPALELESGKKKDDRKKK